MGAATCGRTAAGPRLDGAVPQPAPLFHPVLQSPCDDSIEQDLLCNELCDELAAAAGARTDATAAAVDAAAAAAAAFITNSGGGAAFPRATLSAAFPGAHAITLRCPDCGSLELCADAASPTGSHCTCRLPVQARLAGGEPCCCRIHGPAADPAAEAQRVAAFVAALGRHLSLQYKECSEVSGACTMWGGGVMRIACLCHVSSIAELHHVRHTPRLPFPPTMQQALHSSLAARLRQQARQQAPRTPPRADSTAPLALALP